MNIELLLTLFFIAFALNILWEVLHSVLYTTCHEMPLGKMQRLLVVMALKDAFWITAFYTVSVFIFETTNVMLNIPQLIFFVLLAFIFSYIDEYVSLRTKRWEYASSMPTLFGIGWSPLLELVITGVLTFSIVFTLVSFQ